MDFKTFKDYANHGRIFNACFLAFLSCIFSIAAGIVIYMFNDLNFGTAAYIYILLAIIPPLTFLLAWTNYTVRTSIWESWQDIIRGRLDRRKILSSYTSAYRIDTWKTKVNTHCSDGYWSFQNRTLYIRRMTEQRNFWISLLFQECNHKIAVVDRKITDATSTIRICQDTLAQSKKTDKSIKTALRRTEQPDEVRYLLQRVEEMNVMGQQKEQAIAEQSKLIEQLQSERKEIIDTFYRNGQLIIDSYNARNERYSEPAIKTINRINNSHYIARPIPESQLLNMRRELIEAPLKID